MVFVREWRYSKLFTKFSIDRMMKYKDPSPSIWLINDLYHMTTDVDWSNMEATLVVLLTLTTFLRKYMIFDSASLFLNLIQSQIVHSKLIVIKHRPIFMIIRRYSLFLQLMELKKILLDVVARGKVEPQRFFIQRDDILFDRNDITHCVCQNIGDYPNHCIHILIVLANLHDKAATKSAPLTDFLPCPK